jgi:hypothetical protein
MIIGIRIFTPVVFDFRTHNDREQRLRHQTDYHDRVPAVHVDPKHGLDPLNADRRRATEERPHRLRAGDVDQLDIEIVFRDKFLIDRDPRHDRGSRNRVVGHTQRRFRCRRKHGR